MVPASWQDPQLREIDPMRPWALSPLSQIARWRPWAVGMMARIVLDFVAP
jgi:hypothetical protein